MRNPEYHPRVCARRPRSGIALASRHLRRAAVPPRVIQGLAIAGLLIAIGGIVYSSVSRSGGEDGSERIHFICANCKHEFERKVADVGARPGIQTCPKCGKRSGETGTLCPDCGKWFLVTAVDEQENPACPRCKPNAKPLERSASDGEKRELFFGGNRGEAK